MDKQVLSIAVVILVVGLGAGYISPMNQLSTLQSQILGLETENSAAASQYTQLNQSYNALLAEHTQLNTSYNELTAQFYQLLTDYTGLDEAYAQLDINYSNLLEQYAQLEQEVEYEVYALTDQDYYYSILADLQAANASISVACYSMRYDPVDANDWANDLIRELVNAKNRGITVTVARARGAAYNFLSANNVDVQFDNETDTDHMNLVIIDGTIVYVGSHFWSESSLNLNHETSVKIISDRIASIFEAYFETV